MVEKTVERWGHLDYAVNDAGISGRFAPFDQLKIEEFDKVMNVDFQGTMLSLHAEIQQFVKQGKVGSVVNISSNGAMLATDTMSPYITAKTVVIGLTKSVALDYADTKIRVNSVAPGTVHTAMTAPVFDDQTPGSFGQQLKQMLPAKRYGEPQEIGQAAYFLASDNTSYINGAVLVADACGPVGTKG